MERGLSGLCQPCLFNLASRFRCRVADPGVVGKGGTEASRPQSAAHRRRALRRAQCEPCGATAWHESARREQGAAAAARDVRRCVVCSRAERYRSDPAGTRDRASRASTPAASSRGSAQGRTLRSGHEHAADRSGALRHRRDGVPAVDPGIPPRAGAEVPGRHVHGARRVAGRRIGKRRRRRRGRLLSGARAEKLPSASVDEAWLRLSDARGTSAVEEPLDRVGVPCCRAHRHQAGGP